MSKGKRPTKKPTQALKVPPANDEPEGPTLRGRVAVDYLHAIDEHKKRCKTLEYVYNAVTFQLSTAASHIDTLAYNANESHHTDARDNLKLVISEAEEIIALAQEALTISKFMTTPPQPKLKTA